jgi:putative transposase
VSQAWFYQWRHGDVSVRWARKRALAEVIAALFARHRGTYGSPRITADLRDLGWRVSKNTVAALMREQNLVARRNTQRRHSSIGMISPVDYELTQPTHPQAGAA